MRNRIRNRIKNRMCKRVKEEEIERNRNKSFYTTIEKWTRARKRTTTRNQNNTSRTWNDPESTSTVRGPGTGRQTYVTHGDIEQSVINLLAVLGKCKTHRALDIDWPA